MEFDELSNRVIGCAIKVHRHLGPGIARIRIRTMSEAQLQTYMKLTEVKIGLLKNFNVTKLNDGIKRVVH